MTIRFDADGWDDVAARVVSDGARPVTAAREFAAGVLDRWTVPAPVRTDAVLLVSELVTNALVHGAGPIEVRLHCGGGQLLIDVRDTSPAQPRLRHPGVDSTGGRGLRIVAAVAGAWGSRSTPGGKAVWCTLATAQ